MRIILLILLVASIAVVHGATNDASKVTTDERQFVSSLRKWIFGRGDETGTAKTQIKYLPIYVPVPIYSTKPGGAEYYGALQHDHGIHRDIEMKLQTPVGPTLPYPHAEDYSLPFSSHLQQGIRRKSLPYYITPYGEEFLRPQYVKPDHISSLYNPYDHYVDESDRYPNTEPNNDDDSEVVENPYVRQTVKLVSVDSHLRKRKRYKKKKVVESDD